MQTQQAPYDVSVHRTHSTITIRPQLTEAEWSEIERAGNDILNRINGAKPQGLLVDLTPLEYMGSSMVAMIVRCWKAVHPQKQRFVVVTDSDVVREVLDLSGLAKMWTIVPSLDEGLKTLGVSPGGAYDDSAGAKWTLILSVVGLLAAIVGVGIWFAQPGQRPLATGLIYGGAAAGFVLGLIGMILAQGNRRFIALGVVLVCAGLGVFRLMQTSPAGAANEAVSPEDAEEAAAQDGKEVIAPRKSAPIKVPPSDEPAEP